jgi:hypothetical protein
VGEWADPALAGMISELLYEYITNGSGRGCNSPAGRPLSRCCSLGQVRYGNENMSFSILERDLTIFRSITAEQEGGTLIERTRLRFRIGIMSGNVQIQEMVG